MILRAQCASHNSDTLTLAGVDEHDSVHSYMNRFLTLSLLFAISVNAQETPLASAPLASAALASADAKIARQAIATFIEQGPDSLPQLREYTRSDDPRLRSRANETIGNITGQYGSQVDLIWKRSLAEAIKASGGKKPILMLHLFGNLNEEFC